MRAECKQASAGSSDGSAPTTIAWSVYPVSAVIVFVTADGSFGKLYTNEQPGALGNTGQPSPFLGLSLHAQAGGSFAY